MKVKNLRTRCEGLSPGLFVFSILGNVTFSASILATGPSAKHLAVSAAWLSGKSTNYLLPPGTGLMHVAGSMLTVFLDGFVRVHSVGARGAIDADGTVFESRFYFNLYTTVGCVSRLYIRGQPRCGTRARARCVRRVSQGRVVQPRGSLFIFLVPDAK
jgi:hypothetical protein